MMKAYTLCFLHFSIKWFFSATAEQNRRKKTAVLKRSDPRGVLSGMRMTVCKLINVHVEAHVNVTRWQNREPAARWRKVTTLQRSLNLVTLERCWLACMTQRTDKPADRSWAVAPGGKPFVLRRHWSAGCDQNRSRQWWTAPTELLGLCVCFIGCRALSRSNKWPCSVQQAVWEH